MGNSPTHGGRSPSQTKFVGEAPYFNGGGYNLGGEMSPKYVQQLQSSNSRNTKAQQLNRNSQSSSKKLFSAIRTLDGGTSDFQGRQSMKSNKKFKLQIPSGGDPKRPITAGFSVIKPQGALVGSDAP